MIFASVLFFVILQSLFSGAMSLELVPFSNSPINTSSSVVASLQCTKNSDESYAVCASNFNIAIKYNLQPFSFAAKGPTQGNYMRSCDLYETSSQSSSRAICVKGYSGTNGIVYFHRVSDMINVTNVTIGLTGNSPHVIVDTSNHVAYVSNHYNPPAIYKITNIGSSTPVVAGNLTSFGSGDRDPAAMLIVDGFLYVHCVVDPARLARINISTFVWNQTVKFASGESIGPYDNLANDDNFIYDLTENGILVRCTYKNNNFSRFDSLSTGYSQTSSLAISPDLTTLIATSVANGVLQMVSISSFSKLGNPVTTALQYTDSLAISPDQRTLFVASFGNSVLQMVNVASFSKFGNVVTVPSAFGRPIIISWCSVYAFGFKSDSVYAFRLNSTVCGTPSAQLTSSLSTQRTTSNSRSLNSATSSFFSASLSASLSTQRTKSRPVTNSVSKNSATASPNSSASASHLTVSPIATLSISQSQLTATGDASWSSSHSISAADATSSSSRETHSISADVSNTKSLEFTPSLPNISTSSSSSITRIKSSSFSPSRSASAIVPPPPYISPLRDVYETTTATSSLASFASLSSTNVLGAARARSAIGGFSDIVAGTCSLDFKSLSELENGPPDRSSSPIRFKLNGSYLTGQAVGNLIVIFGVGALWMLGYVVIQGRSSNNAKNHHKKKKNKRKTNKKTFVEIIIASNAHVMTLFTLMLLLGPTLTSSAMSLIGEISVEGRTITVLSVVCVVLSWFVLLVIGLGFTIWKLIYVRKFNHDVFELLEEKEANNNDERKKKFWFRRFVEYSTSPFGEWKYVGNHKKEKTLFELARPLIEPFTNKWPKFIVIDVGVIVLLSLAEVIPRMIPDNSSACFLRGVTVCFTLSLHVLFVFYYRPLYSDRMSNTVGCLVDSLSVLVVGGAMTIAENNESQIKGWSRVAIAQAGLQMMMSALQVIEILLPVWDGGVKLVKKHCSSKPKKTKDHKSNKAIRHEINLAEMMNQEQEQESFTSPLLQEMTVISQAENESSQNKKKRQLLKKRKSLLGTERRELPLVTSKLM